MITTKKNLSPFQLEKIKLRTPAKAGALWHGIPHGKLLQAVETACDTKDWTAQYDSAALSRDRADLVLQFVVRPSDLPMPMGWDCLLVIKSSNASRWATRVAIAVRDRVHGTILPLAFVSLGSRRGEFALVEALQQAIYELSQSVHGAERVVRLYLNTPLRPAEAEHFLCTLGKEKILPWKRLGNVVGKLGETVSLRTLYQFLSRAIDRSPACARWDQWEIRFKLRDALEHLVIAKSRKPLEAMAV